MKKTINISIGGMSFQVEEDAYQALENYLNAIKQKFAAYPDASEIVSDMEDRIAEQFATKTQNDKIITLALVEELISVMGRPEQFGEDKEKTAPGKTSSAFGKRLFRNPDDVLVAGVCSGIAAYLDVDPVWVRLIFALTIFFGGFGILLYLILWIIVPFASTDTEKMQMRGEAVNLKNLETMVKERVEELKKKDKSPIKKVLAAPFRVVGQIFQALGRLIKKIFPLLFKLIGLCITVAASLGIAVLVFVAFSLLFNANSPYVDFPFKELAHGTIYYAALASAFFAAFVPAVFLSLLGTSLMSMRPSLSKMGGFSLLGLWILSLIVLVNMGIKLAPQIEQITQTSPYFREVGKTYDLKNFTAVDLSGADSLNFYQGDSFKVMATGTEKDLGNAKLVVENGVLKLDRDNKIKFCIFCNIKSVKYTVYAPAINALSASGASRINAGNLKAANIKVNLSGASRANLSVQATQTTAELSGASRLELSGTSTALTAEISGASSVNAQNAMLAAANVNLSGASRASFGKLNSLEVIASGASTVTYQQTMSLKQNLSGASRIKQSFETDNENYYDYTPDADKQYTNEIYGFKFNYPGNYQMQAGENLNNGFYLPIENYFYQNKKGERVITALLPKETFPSNTDFAGGFLSVSVIKNSTSAQCYKFGNQATPSSQKLNINGADFALADASSAGLGHQAMDKIYHSYNNNICYEIDMGARTEGFGANEQITEQVSKDAIFAKLQPLLQSFEVAK
ncbi:MAG: DUF2807 domain-containing protein [Candidatus Doudnabacteria bacterium]|nr:DUF2807 domain-containing protein [Candidatus Doudnabacteria bacterium]